MRTISSTVITLTALSAILAWFVVNSSANEPPSASKDVAASLELVVDIGFLRNAEGEKVIPTPRVFDRSGEEFTVDAFAHRFRVQAQLVRELRAVEVEDVTVVIRADREVPHESVNRLVQHAQDAGFERYAFKVARAEKNDDRIRTEQSPARTTARVVPDPRPLKVRLLATPDGRLAGVRLDGREFGKGEAAFRRLNTEIRDLLEKDRNKGTPKSRPFEVEIDADPDLHFRYTLQAISAVTKYVDRSGGKPRTVKLVEKIRFSVPRKARAEP